MIKYFWGQAGKSHGGICGLLWLAPKLSALGVQADVQHGIPSEDQSQ